MRCNYIAKRYDRHQAFYVQWWWVGVSHGVRGLLLAGWLPLRGVEGALLFKPVGWCCHFAEVPLPQSGEMQVQPAKE